MKLSQFGEKLTRRTGILELMDDMGKALSGSEKQYMLGGGNPAHIPEMIEIWRRRVEALLANSGELAAMLTDYDTPRGGGKFLEALAHLLSREYGWRVSEKITDPNQLPL